MSDTLLLIAHYPSPHVTMVMSWSHNTGLIQPQLHCLYTGLKYSPVQSGRPLTGTLIYLHAADDPPGESNWAWSMLRLRRISTCRRLLNMAGLDLSNIVRAASSRHYHVSVGYLRDWSAGNEINCHSANAQPATCLVQQGSAAPTGGGNVPASPI